jgi:selenide,water dikinase
MGARPLVALNVVGFPSQRLPVAVLEAILRGARDKAAEAGIAIAGGHTVDDVEPKFGLAVTGVVDPARLLTNAGARPGDVLVLTKPIGTGILATALKQGLLDADAATVLQATMASLNRAAGEAAVAEQASACTDVTGFGLLGHLREMMDASGVTARVQAADVPLLPGVVELATSGVVPGGTRDNLAHTLPHTRWPDDLGELRRLVLNDAQTSGGLLIAVAADRAGELVTRLREAGVSAATIIGEVVPREELALQVV